MKRLAIFLLFLLAAPLWAAPDLGGKEVFLIVTAERHDRDGEWLELEVRDMRHTLGFDTEELPVVRMGLLDSDGKGEYFQKLSIAATDLPALLVVKWSEKASDGPAAVVEGFRLTQLRSDEKPDRPRALFMDWLTKNGKENLVSLIAPPPEEPSVPAVSPAQQALDEGRLEQAILLARQEQDPNTELKARQVYQEQGSVAVSEGRKELATAIYETLLRLYPTDEFFAAKVKELHLRPADLMCGRWEMKSSLGWFKFTAFPDGRLEGKTALYLIPLAHKKKGTWTVTGETERTFQLKWSNGAIYNIRFHENGDTFEGKGVSDGNVSGRRLDE